MTPAQYLQEIGSLTALSLVPNCSPIKASSELVAHKCYGTVIGERSGFIVAISRLKMGNQARLGIMIRYPKLNDTSMLTEELKALPGIKGILKTKELKVSADSAVLLWTFSLRAPKRDEVIEMLDAMLSKVSTYCSRFNGKCEDCASNSTTGIVLYNDVPGYHCSTCQARIAEQQALAAENYESGRAEYVKAVPLTLLVAAGCAAVQGAALFWLSDAKGTPAKLWALIGVLTAMAVGMTFAKTIGKVDIVRQAPIVFLLSWVSMLVGDVVFFTWYVAPVAHVAPSWSLARWVVANLVQFKTDGFLDVMITLCQIGAAVFSVFILKKQKPIFTPVFRPMAAETAVAVQAHA